MTTAPPPMTDRNIIEVRKAQVGRYGTVDPTKPYADSVAFARAIIAARDAHWQATIAANPVERRVPSVVDLCAGPLHGFDDHCDPVAAPVAQQYEAGDMASAAAQGFRDGVASVTQQEPVAWVNGSDLELMRKHGRGCIAWRKEQRNAKTPLYAAPVAQQHVPEADCGNIKAQQPQADEATAAGFEASINILSQLVDEQRQLLAEVDAVFGADEHGIVFEDGDSALIDRVRAHLAATNEAKQPQADSLESLLSTAIGLLMGYEDRDGKGGTRNPYKPGSAVANFVAECVERLKDWPLTTSTQQPQAEAVPSHKKLTDEQKRELIIGCETYLDFRAIEHVEQAVLSQQAGGVPQNWRNALPGCRHTDKWNSSRVADYNQGWNDCRKAANTNLEKLTAHQQAEAVPPDVVRDAAPIPDHELVTMYDERPTSDLEMIEFAREVERRHGIGVQPQHITDGSPCWCNPDVAYTDPETSASVIVHRRPQ